MLEMFSIVIEIAILNKIMQAENVTGTCIYYLKQYCTSVVVRKGRIMCHFFVIIITFNIRNRRE